MKTVEVFAPAKVNLTLHVTGRRADGYHLLDSLVVFAGVGDILRVTPADRMELRLHGPLADGVPDDARNLVWRAGQAAGLTLSVSLEKHLPHAAGIGGGSSDAGALLRAAQSLGGTTVDPMQLGADVPVCVNAPAPQRMRGVGADVVPVAGLPEGWLVLVNPGVDVPTGAVFAALGPCENAPMAVDLPRWSNAADLAAWLRSQRNDLQAAAIGIVPAIAEVLKALEDAPVARMSGSGATCFGLFPDAGSARRAANRIAAARPDWWVVATEMLRG